MTSVAATIDPRRMEHGRIAAIVLVTFGVIFPYIREYLVDFPVIGDFVPGIRSMVYVLVVTMMALGLNIVVGYAGLLDLGYVAFYAAGAYTAGWLASQQFNDLNIHLFSTARRGFRESTSPCGSFSSPRASSRRSSAF